MKKESSSRASCERSHSALLVVPSAWLQSYQRHHCKRMPAVATLYPVDSTREVTLSLPTLLELTQQIPAPLVEPIVDKGIVIQSRVS